MRSRRSAEEAPNEHELSSAAKATGDRADASRAGNSHHNSLCLGHGGDHQRKPSGDVPDEPARPANKILGRTSPNRAPGSKLNRTRRPRSRRETPPSGYRAALRKRNGAASGFDGIATLAVFALGQRNSQAHLLADRPRQKPAHRMRLPPGGLHQLFGGYPAGPLEQVQRFVGLAALAGPRRFLRAFGRCR